MRDCHVKHWLQSGSTWIAIMENGKRKRSKLWIFVTIMMMIISLTVLGYLAGYAVGYNDSLASEVAKYRVAKKMR